MKLKCIVFALLVFFTFGSCDKEEEIVYNKAQRTILVYFVASNLGSYLQSNLDAMMSVAQDQNLRGGNLIVYYSKNQSEAELYRIKEGKNGTVEKQLVKTYTDQSAVSTETMRSVIQDVTTCFPAESYGMILSSHATAWLPTNYTSLRSFGEENGKNMEINEINEALEGAPHFDFLLFDACYMASIECAYELKDKADYILASPTETMAEGFPYTKFLPGLFDSTPQLEQTAKAFYDHYMQFSGYSQTATVSLVKTSELNQLAVVVKDILADKTESSVYSLSLSNMQLLEHLSRSKPYMLYDFADYMKQLATPEQYARFTESLNKVIVCKYNTPRAFFAVPNTSFPINSFSGLSVFVPQQSLPKMLDWYKQLTWYKAVYNW